MIRHKGSKFCVISRSTGRSLGCYNTKSEADHREKQVVFFKNLSKSSGRKGSLAAKIGKRKTKKLLGK